jgi:hypothetical protein
MEFQKNYAALALIIRGGVRQRAPVRVQQLDITQVPYSYRGSLMTVFITQAVLFSGEFLKRVTISIDQPDCSSDRGAVLLETVGAQL